MSKLDAQRAMREARYAARQKAAAATPTSPTARRAVRPPVAPPADPAPAQETAGEQLCGHRNMGGKTCTRELGHAAKNHRYS